MIRAVLAVVLTTALLGVSLPAIDDARRDHSEAVVSAELRDVGRAATDMLETDDPTDDGARRVVDVYLPERSWSDTGVEAVTIGESRNGSGGRLTWTVEGGTRSTRHLPGIPLRAASGRSLSLAGSGRKRLVLSLGGTTKDPVVTVRRFTSDEGTIALHATVATDSNRRTGRGVRLRSDAGRWSTRRRRRQLFRRWPPGDRA